MVRRSNRPDGSGGLQPQRPQAGGGIGQVGSGSEFFRVWWNSSDSLVHEKVRGGSDLGAIGRSKVETFRFGRADSLVELRLLQLRSPSGERVKLTTTVNLYNR